MPWKRAGSLKLLCALAEIACLIDVVAWHVYFPNRFHHLVQRWSPRVPLALQRAAPQNMSFYVYLLILGGHDIQAIHYSKLERVGPLLSVGSTPLTFSFCAPLKSLQCSWLCWQDNGSECWMTRQCRSTWCIRRAVLQACGLSFELALCSQAIIHFQLQPLTRIKLSTPTFVRCL